MSSTNKTTNYELSQFVGSDKPAWLADYNQDMSKIDTGMKANADGVTAATGKADTNASNIGDLTYLSTTAKNTLVAAINEVDSGVTTAQNTANSASTAANTANTNIAKFNLSDRATLTPSVNKGSITSGDVNTVVQFATDTTNSIFKIYGRISIANLASQTGTLTITVGQTSLRPATAYTINCGAIVSRIYNTGITDTVPRNLTVNTDGSITITDTTTLSSGAITNMVVMLPPCLYFNSDFGDE